MKFEHRKVTLKDGRTCVLCPTYPEYAEEMIEYLKITAAETPFVLRYPDEVNYTLEGEKEILGRLLEDEGSVMMLALVDGKVAGNASINGLGNKRKILHRCSLAIALKKEYWNLGIGKAMIEYLIELAKKIGFEQMDLEVVDGNDNAKYLYEKCGFVETGKRMRALKDDDGTYRDEILMYRVL